MRMLVLAFGVLVTSSIAFGSDIFIGRHYRGRGDVEYLRFLEISRRLFEPDPQYENLSMLYQPEWNGLVEGLTWDAWWIQNSYGTTYAELPFLQEPFITFLQNSQDLWFDQMGDGHRKGYKGWVAPDGCLCDCARPGWIAYRQGDGKTEIHDWGMEFTAAGVVMQAELLLISRDQKAIAHYLPKLHRSIDFIESRRDRKNNLFLAGPAANLLAPSYAGYREPNGTYGKAYLTGLSITYIAALGKMIELEKLAHDEKLVAEYKKRRSSALAGLAQLTTAEGYFIRSLDPDGTKHGVFGAPQHGYFESSPNLDAIALHVVGDAQAEKIYNKIASIPQLRPHAFILANYPSYDDMYEKPTGLWSFGTWVNGGAWSTCEGRIILAYSRLNKFNDIRASMRQLMKFIDSFRMDNPLTNQGDDVYQPKEPINLCYDTFAPPAAMIRGLFEYLYSSDRLVLVPHVPKTITQLEQLDPIRWGNRRIYLSICGAGPITSVKVNGAGWKTFDGKSVSLPYDERLPKIARILIIRGNSHFEPIAERDTHPLASDDVPKDVAAVMEFVNHMDAAGLGDTYEASHARLIVEAARARDARIEGLKTEKLHALPAVSEKAADALYAATVEKLRKGLDERIKSYRNDTDATHQTILRMWFSSHAAGAAR